MIAALVARAAAGRGRMVRADKSKGGAVDAKLAAMKANDIAVLYFDDRSSDHSLRYLSDGLTEALIHELGMVTRAARHVTERCHAVQGEGRRDRTASRRRSASGRS